MDGRSCKLTGYSANYETLKRAVNEYGISIIGLFDYIRTDQVAGLIGINLQVVQRLNLTITPINSLYLRSFYNCRCRKYIIA